MAKKKYLMFCSLAYAFPILRPLQEEILKRGDKCAWFLEKECPNLLTDDELQLLTSNDVKRYNPTAIFAPGNWIYPWFPGIKVQVFHGYPINKRGDKTDDHFRMRGWFDMYCTSGETSTPTFQLLSERLGYFKVYETGWCKVDSLVKSKEQETDREKPTIFVATTFSKNICALRTLFPKIKELVEKNDWNWTITMHPKLNDAELTAMYEQLAQEHKNVTFSPQTKVEDMVNSDVMLCDSSSIIVEYLMLEKPVVTYRNTIPGNHLINVEKTDEIETAIIKALSRPNDLMQSIKQITQSHEGHQDGKNCSRILDAVDDFETNYKGKINRKPLNLIRRIKLRIRQL